MCLLINNLRPLFSSATYERRNITADLISCHATRSSEQAFFLPHFNSRCLAIQPSIIIIKVSSLLAAWVLIFGSYCGLHASPTLRTVVITFSSLRSQPHTPQTFAAFSNDPVSHAVVTILRSSACESAPRSPRNNLSRNGVSHPPVDFHCPQST